MKDVFLSGRASESDGMCVSEVCRRSTLIVLLTLRGAMNIAVFLAALFACSDYVFLNTCLAESSRQDLRPKVKQCGTISDKAQRQEVHRTSKYAMRCMKALDYWRLVVFTCRPCGKTASLHRKSLELCTRH
jgi:hypothetical protein